MTTRIRRPAARKAATRAKKTPGELSVQPKNELGRLLADPEVAGFLKELERFYQEQPSGDPMDRLRECKGMIAIRAAFDFALDIVKPEAAE